MELLHLRVDCRIWRDISLINHFADMSLPQYFFLPFNIRLTHFGCVIYLWLNDLWLNERRHGWWRCNNRRNLTLLLLLLLTEEIVIVMSQHTRMGRLTIRQQLRRLWNLLLLWNYLRWNYLWKLLWRLWTYRLNRLSRILRCLNLWIILWLLILWSLILNRLLLNGLMLLNRLILNTTYLNTWQLRSYLFQFILILFCLQFTLLLQLFVRTIVHFPILQNLTAQLFNLFPVLLFGRFMPAHLVCIHMIGNISYIIILLL